MSSAGSHGRSGSGPGASLTPKNKSLTPLHASASLESLDIVSPPHADTLRPRRRIIQPRRSNFPLLSSGPLHPPGFDQQPVSPTASKMPEVIPTVSAAPPAATSVAVSSKRPAARSLEAPRKLTTAEFIDKMLSSEWVTILAGPKKQKFKCSAEILSHYSPFFDAMLNGQSIEGRTRVVELPEDDPDDIEVMIDWLIRGNVQDILTTERWGDKIIERCIGFLVFAKKYCLKSVETTIHEPLEKALKLHAVKMLCGEFIEQVFEATSIGSRLRVLITKAALSVSVPRDVKKNEVRFRKQELEVPGFAAEAIRQFRMGLENFSWKDPLKVKKSSSIYSSRHESDAVDD